MPGAHGVLCKELIDAVIEKVNADPPLEKVNADPPLPQCTQYTFQLQYPTQATHARRAFHSLMERNILKANTTSKNACLMAGSHNPRMRSLKATKLPTRFADETKREGTLSVGKQESTVRGFPDALNYLCLPIGHMQISEYIRRTHPDLECNAIKYGECISDGLVWMEGKLGSCYTAPFVDETKPFVDGGLSSSDRPPLTVDVTFDESYIHRAVTSERQDPPGNPTEGPTERQGSWDFPKRGLSPADGNGDTANSSSSNSSGRPFGSVTEL